MVENNKTKRNVYVPRYSSPRREEGISYYVRKFAPSLIVAALVVGGVYVFKNGFIDQVVKPAQAYSVPALRDVSNTNNASKLEDQLK